MEIYSGRKLQAYKSEILPRGKIFEYRMREYKLREYQHIFFKNGKARDIFRYWLYYITLNVKYNIYYFILGYELQIRRHI